jgi:hypothetical protein
MLKQSQVPVLELLDTLDTAVKTLAASPEPIQTRLVEAWRGIGARTWATRRRVQGKRRLRFSDSISFEFSLQKILEIRLNLEPPMDLQNMPGLLCRVELDVVTGAVPEIAVAGK